MANGSGVGTDFNLPDEILSVIPTDPYDQLDLARKITSMAIASRVTNLENEAGKLRQKLHEKDRLIEELEDKVSHLDGAYQDAELRLKIMTEDNMKLLKERDSLVLTANKLTRDLAKLETFKRQLMESLKDENSQQAESVDIGTYDQAVPKPFSISGESNGYTKHHSYGGSTTESMRSNDDVSKLVGQRFSITPYITPRLTPTGTPKVVSTSVSPRRHSSHSPQTISGTTSPTRLDRYSLSSANSPPRGHPLPARTPRIDGKEFFRQARSRLSLEQFSAFLANIKELNAQKQSREETLRKAEEIFGMDNKDLFISFQGLLNRNIR